MHIRDILFVGCVLSATIGWIGCRNCKEESQEPPEPAKLQTSEKRDAEAQAHREKEAVENRDPVDPQSAEKTMQKKYPNVEMIPGAVVEMAKRPRDIQALRDLSERSTGSGGNKSSRQANRPAGGNAGSGKKPR